MNMQDLSVMVSQQEILQISLILVVTFSMLWFEKLFKNIFFTIFLSPPVKKTIPRGRRAQNYPPLGPRGAQGALGGPGRPLGAS